MITTRNKQTFLASVAVVILLGSGVASPVFAATTCADQMKVVKAAWDKAPAGPKKDAALVHYTAAQKAETAKDEATCLKDLDAAVAALK